MRLHQRLRGMAVATVLAALAASPVQAGQIFIQQSGTAPAGGDANLITNTSSFVVGLAGSGSTLNPLLIGIADYNGAGPAPTVGYSGCATPAACPLASVGTYGLTANTVTGFNSGTVFAAVGLANAGGSVSFSNLASREVSQLGLAAPTSFTLYIFQLPTGLGSGTISISTTAGYGDYIFAYACDAVNTAGACVNAGKTSNTVMTNSALVSQRTTPVPEPASLVLFGAALAGLGMAARRRFRAG